MKKLLLFSLIIAGIAIGVFTQFAPKTQETPQGGAFGDTIGALTQWKASTTPNLIIPRNNNANIQIPALGSSSDCLVTNSTGVFATSTCGGVATPGGSTGQLQYNNVGVLGGIATGTAGTVLAASSTSATGYEWKSVGGTGTVTSVDLSVPTGLTVSGNPVTTVGTLAIALQSGYTIPTSTLINNLNVFYTTPSNRITAGTNLSWSGNTLNGTMASSTIIAGGTATHSPAITFSTSTDTNLLQTIVCASSACTFTPSWTGTLAAARLNSNVVQSVVNDTNVTGSISAQALTLGWTGTLAVSRGGSGAGTLTGVLKGNGTGAFTAMTGTAGFATRWSDTNTLAAAKLIDNGTVIGMNATSSTIGFNIQGTAGTNNVFMVASSTGTGILAVSALSRVGINTSSPVAILQVQGTNGANNTTPIFDVASSSGTSVLQVTATSEVLLDPTAKIRLPYSASQTLLAGGQIYVDSTAGQVQYHDGSVQRSLPPFWTKTFWLASTTPTTVTGKAFGTGTTTVDIMGFPVPVTMSRVACQTRAGTVSVQAGNGTASSTSISIGTGGASTTPSTTFVADQSVFVDVGGTSSGDSLRCTLQFYPTNQ